MENSFGSLDRCDKFLNRLEDGPIHITDCEIKC